MYFPKSIPWDICICRDCDHRHSCVDAAARTQSGAGRGAGYAVRIEPETTRLVHEPVLRHVQRTHPGRELQPRNRLLARKMAGYVDALPFAFGENRRLLLPGRHGRSAAAARRVRLSLVDAVRSDDCHAPLCDQRFGQRCEPRLRLQQQRNL